MNSNSAVAFAFLVIGIVIIARSFFRYMGSRNRPSQGPDAETLDVLRRLEERVKALETVVSDQGYELKEKFKELERH